MKIATVVFLAILTAAPVVAAEFVPASGEFQTHWTELGDVSEKTKFYDEGARITHPAGVEYVRQGGNWVIYTPSASVPEPASWLLLAAGLFVAGMWRRRD